MKNSAAVALATILSDNCQTIEVRFKDHTGSACGGSYTYKAPKNLELKEGDEVVVNSPSTGAVVVVVTKVHETMSIDIDAPFSYTWIMHKVCHTTYDANMEKDNAVREKVEELQAKAKQARAVSTLMSELGLDEAGLKDVLSSLA